MLVIRTQVKNHQDINFSMPYKPIAADASVSFCWFDFLVTESSMLKFPNFWVLVVNAYSNQHWEVKGGGSGI